jgi:hypothetical protein
VQLEIILFPWQKDISIQVLMKGGMEMFCEKEDGVER